MTHKLNGFFPTDIEKHPAKYKSYYDRFSELIIKAFHHVYKKEDDQRDETYHQDVIHKDNAGLLDDVVLRLEVIANKIGSDPFEHGVGSQKSWLTYQKLTASRTECNI
jgi:hypothetical protein